MTTKPAGLRAAPWARSGAYVVAIAAVSLLSAAETTGWQRGGVLALGALAAAASLWRRRFPYLLVACACAMTALATQALLVPALFNLGVRRARAGALVAAGVSVGLLAIVSSRGERVVSIEGIDLDATSGLVGWALNALAIVAVPYAAGAFVSTRRALTDSLRARAEHAEAERAARAAEAVLRERARIAADAHDVLGHKLSLVALQAGGLELHAGDGAEVVAEQARLLRRSAGDALDELRVVIGSLEEAGSEAAGDPRATSSAGPAGIRRLVAESRRAGAVVDIVDDRLKAGAALPPETAGAAFRIVQECLSNAHRHSPGAPVRLVLSGGPGESLRIECRNAVAEAPRRAALRAGGRGLAGMQRQTSRAGGRLVAFEEDSVFVVRADLPWPDPVTTAGEDR